MTTAAQIIALAMKDIGALGASETASAEDAADSLTTLNQLLGQWGAQKSHVPNQQAIAFAATGAQTYTIGAGGDINTALPAAIDSAFYRLNDVDYQVEVLNSFENYESISSKTLAGTIPAAIFLQRSYPLGTLYVWPQPSNGTIYLVTRATLPTYALTDDLNLPADYELALRYSLAELLLTAFHLSPRPDVVALAARARKVMRRNNLDIPKMGMPDALAGTTYNIARD